MIRPPHVPLDFRRLPEAQMRERAQAFYEDIRRRRTVREFSAEPVPREIIEQAILSAGTAPSGANQQPWHFAVIESAALKKRVREAAEEEERAFYNGRAPQEWLDALAPLGTDEHKPFLETAPYLIAVFAIKSGPRPDGSMVKHYYVPESVGIASGLLVAGGTMAIVLGNVNDRGLGRETVLAAGALGLLVFFSLLWSLSYAAGCMLVIVRETAEGADQMNESPDIDWRDWIFQLVYVAEILAQGVALGWFVRWLLTLALPGTPAPAIGLAIVTFVAFPVLLLSALESGSALLPFSGPILRSLFRLSWAWGLFYLLSGALLVPIIAIAALVATPYATLGWLAPAPLVAAYLLIYARLLGRLGWLIAERLQPPDLDWPDKEAEIAIDLFEALDPD